MLQVFRRYLRHREIQEARLTEALEDLVDFPLTRYPHEPLVGRVWDLRSRMTAYDAAYVALAEALDAPLVTFDARLARTTGHDAAIRFAGRR